MTRLVFSLIATAGLVFSAAVVAGREAGRSGRAVASLRNAQGRAVGDATASREGGAVRIRLRVRGFVPGTHGVHLHDTGRCDAPAFASAGPHWNPGARQHGRLNPHGPHEGDLPNLQVQPDGSGWLAFDLPVPAGTAARANPLLDADGTSIVIHAAADDERSDPAGNSGARIACGVFAPVR